MRKHFLMLTTLACLTAAASTGVNAAKPHVHGTGSLDVLIDQGEISITLSLPLDAAVGFERAPRNEKETTTLAAAARVLDDIPFLPTPSARCSLQLKTVGMPIFAAGEHADIDASYLFICARPTALKGIETTLFKHFKRLYRLEVQRVGPAGQLGQGAMRLTPRQTVISW
jgi:hypothetical protein